MDSFLGAAGHGVGGTLGADVRRARHAKRVGTRDRSWMTRNIFLPSAQPPSRVDLITRRRLSTLAPVYKSVRPRDPYSNQVRIARPVLRIVN